MSNKQPRISIGLPVYNGENFLQKTLDSILNQTFEDFELIISDNASIDKTEKICREHADKDRRIRYYRNEQNLGASQNFNRVFHLSRGEYFKWAAHDDVLAPTFLEKCIQVLDSDFSIVLCYPKTKVIDRKGDFFDSDELYIKLTNANVRLNTDSPKPSRRFRDVACFPHSCYPIFGVIRKSILKNTPLIARYAGSDRVLLARLSLLGRFYEFPEYLLFLRRHSQQSVNINSRSMHLYNIWHDPVKQGKITFPYWKLFIEYLMAINQVSLNWQEKIACYLQIRHWLPDNWKFLRRDLLVVALQILEKVYSGLNDTKLDWFPQKQLAKFILQISIILYRRLHKEELFLPNISENGLVFGRYPKLGQKNVVNLNNTEQEIIFDVSTKIGNDTYFGS
ncbi:glycosyltransferase family 2 protein [Pleurocapsales cyanobacterium LEGE 06147]|nr:glycosyltransferase family 2 protein [Pleurocapsales cyanobacterium LEGE 06147]